MHTWLCAVCIGATGFIDALWLFWCCDASLFHKILNQVVRTDKWLCQRWWEYLPERCESLIIYSKQHSFNGWPEKTLLVPFPCLSKAPYRHSLEKCVFVSFRKELHWSSCSNPAALGQKVASPPVDFNPHFTSFLIFLSNVCTEENYFGSLELFYSGKMGQMIGFIHHYLFFAQISISEVIFNPATAHSSSTLPPKLAKLASDLLVKIKICQHICNTIYNETNNF